MNSTKKTYVQDLIEALKKADISLENVRSYIDSVANPEDAVVDDEAQPLDEQDDWVSKEGDWGVAEFANDNIASMKKRLGIDEKVVGVPYFNNVWSIHSKLPNEMDAEHWEKVNTPPLKADLLYKNQLEILDAREHQYKGVAAILKNAAFGRNTVLADAVGLGKTIQALMVAAMLRYLKDREKKAVCPLGKSLVFYHWMMSNLPTTSVV